MNLHEAAAVYLIIGAATLGPFEGHSCADFCSPYANADSCEKECNRDHSQVNDTPAEICVKALRYVGAHHPSQSQPGVSNDVYSMSSGWLLFDRPVLCVPAPSGMKR